jgi:hypothetical protein
MSDQNKPFVVTDRRRHTMEGDLRPDADPSPEREERVDPKPEAVPERAGPVAAADVDGPEADDDGRGLPQAPNEEQMMQARLAYTQTADRLSTAIRAANPGMDHPPPMNFDGLVQSVYMTAIMQLGGATPEGQQPQVDLMGAQQSIEMLTVLGEKTKGNLTAEESSLLDRAIFELQMAFLEITQALARSAAAKQQQAQGFGGPGQGPGQGPGGRPSIVR